LAVGLKLAVVHLKGVEEVKSLIISKIIGSVKESGGEVVNKLLVAFRLVSASSESIETIDNSFSIEVPVLVGVRVCLGVASSFVSDLVQGGHFQGILHDLVSELLVFKFDGGQSTKGRNLFLKVFGRSLDLLANVLV